MKKKLFIPGPVSVKEDVLAQMTKAIIGHRTVAASDLQRSISEKLQRIFYTKNRIILSTSSGTALMEGAIRSFTKKRAAVFSNGFFGDLWHEMALRNNIEADLFRAKKGKPITSEMVDSVLSTGKYDLITITHNETSSGITNPIEEISEVIKKYPEIVWLVDGVSSIGGIKLEVDKLGIDVCIASTQKCLGLPPGMAIASVSEKAIERARSIDFRGYYLDFLELYETIEKMDYQYISTPALPMMNAIDYQLNKILNEGLENRFKRHETLGNIVRDWAKKYFPLYTEEAYSSNTVTTIENSLNMDIDLLNKMLEKRGFEISNGYGNLRDKTFRIGHMADCTVEELEELIDNLDEIIRIKFCKASA
ncbi:pyridoxal-phosphate-dependent aminotransferase family protein [Tissierella creatinophila]|uniref:Soluble hydrogenase 42 kDa subunit n=1 Tax=Tissierella creatinophila DSM 6911 TaxID=1123403 RepID=A0A1U7M5W3_TISCR|nr:alanine--glyoxylate aminotransferase family protein [Tissierella creatinophila]OLS02609.1 soluble hydrogenase 42 kDa subunit [Tissierella creatinophila DSM 6911]